MITPTPGPALRQGDIIVPWYARTARIVAFDEYRGPFDFIERVAILEPYGPDGFTAASISIERGMQYRVVTYHSTKTDV